MGQTQNNLIDNYGLGAGITPHYSISYDDSLSAADGVNRADGLIGVCEGDYNWMSNLFGNIGVPFTLPVDVRLGRALRRGRLAGLSADHRHGQQFVSLGQHVTNEYHVIQPAQSGPAQSRADHAG